MRMLFVGQRFAAAVLLVSVLGTVAPISVGANEAIAQQRAETAPPSTFDTFLDRLMGAESGGRSHAKNPRSTALGPFQFIKSTFLGVTRRNFPTEIAGLNEAQVLVLRTDRDFSRRAAAAFSKENLSFLKERGLDPTFAHLRLAYLLGAADAAVIVLAQQDTPVTSVLSAAVIKANSFMHGMSAADLLARSERDVMFDRTAMIAAGPLPRVHPAAGARPSEERKAQSVVASRDKGCNRKLASCQRVITVQEKSRKTLRVRGDRKAKLS